MSTQITISNDFPLKDIKSVLQKIADPCFIGAVIETTMLLRESKYIGSVTFEDVQKTLNELTLTNSPSAIFLDFDEKYRTLRDKNAEYV